MHHLKMHHLKSASLVLLCLSFQLSCTYYKNLVNGDESQTTVQNNPTNIKKTEERQISNNEQKTTSNPTKEKQDKAKIGTPTKQANKSQNLNKPSIPTQAKTLSSPTKVTAKKLPTSKVKGKVFLLNSNGTTPSPEGAIVELKKITNDKPPAFQNKNHTIDTRSKTYIPGYLTVNVGDTLVFKNNDSIKHNVFSSSMENTFDLGTYGYNRERQHQVKKEGIIKVYCNIHPEMALFISASQSDLSFITKKNGEFSIDAVPPGKYTLSVWHLRGKTEKTIEVTGGTTITKNLTVDISSYKPVPHLNKHGDAYKKKPAIFKDEFY